MAPLSPSIFVESPTIFVRWFSSKPPTIPMGILRPVGVRRLALPKRSPWRRSKIRLGNCEDRIEIWWKYWKLLKSDHFWNDGNRKPSANRQSLRSFWNLARTMIVFPCGCCIRVRILCIYPSRPTLPSQKRQRHVVALQRGDVQRWPFEWRKWWQHIHRHGIFSTHFPDKRVSEKDDRHHHNQQGNPEG